MLRGSNKPWYNNERRRQTSKRKPQAFALAHTKHDWQFHNISRAMTQTQITETAAHFAELLRFSKIPEAAAKSARCCMIDDVGLIIAGTEEHSVQILTKQACLQGGATEVALLGTLNLKVPASVAAQVMSASGHAHDWEDTQLSCDLAHVYGLLTHPVIPPLTAARIMSQELGGVSGTQFASACCAGFKEECKLFGSTFPHMYKSGFHRSGTVRCSRPALPGGRRAQRSRASFSSAGRLIAPPAHQSWPLPWRFADIMPPRLKNRPSMVLRIDFDRMSRAQNLKVVFAVRNKEVVKATTKGDS
ncbi:MULTISPECIES: MmgE/PrpD family protein [Roseinatronobacter]|uniref:MmgE/PrpD family protein n=1 Tax=Roseinatronobacter domitianus TaxID=2940293 RepID=A0ABT0M5T9_9RHOB|nr:MULTISPECIES: MmgE/PrpD family protein [Roseibaca]MCL1630204.1 MmgE/PrpD family protein [Roseibaca domitiana]